MSLLRKSPLVRRFSILAVLSAMILSLINVPFAFAVPVIDKYEAEAAVLNGGATVSYRQLLSTYCYKKCIYTYDYNASGGAYVSGMSATGAKTTFTVQSPYTGEYKLPIGYTTPNLQDSTLAIKVEDPAGNTVTAQRKVYFSANDSSKTVNSSAEQNEFVRLVEGTNYITLERTADDTGEVYLDYINIIPLVIDTNIIHNPGFETGSITGWYEYHPSGQAAAFGVDGSNTHSGSSKLYFWSETAYEQSIAQNLIGIEKGAYEVSAWVKLQSYSGEQPALAQMVITDIYETHTDLKNIPIPNSSEWTQIKTTVNVSDGFQTGNINIKFHIQAPGYTSMQVDDISVKPLLTNGGFDYGHIQGWTEWHPEGQDAKFGVDKGRTYYSEPHNGSYKLYFYNHQPYQQSIHQKITGLENGTYKVNARVKLSSADALARMEIADHGSEQLNVALPVNRCLQDSCSSGYYDEITASFYVTTGQIDLGFYINAWINDISLQIDSVELYKLQ